VKDAPVCRLNLKNSTLGEKEVQKKKESTIYEWKINNFNSTMRGGETMVQNIKL